MAALEERLGTALNPTDFDSVETLNQLRHLITHPDNPEPDTILQSANANHSTQNISHHTELQNPEPIQIRTTCAYHPHLPPLALVTTHQRSSAQPSSSASLSLWSGSSPHPQVDSEPAAKPITTTGPMLIIANHVTTYDLPLLLYSLPRAIRLHTAAAMSGEMLEDLRRGQNRQPRWLNPLGPPAWLLITALFNVFPLPRRRNFQRSFAHAGQALDCGLNVIIFPEGTRSPDGTLAPFRPGIGLLVKQSSVPVLPMVLRGLGELKTRKHRWFRSGTLQVRVGQPIHFAPDATEAAITARLHTEVEKLIANNRP